MAESNIQALEEFQNITGTDEDTARTMLINNNWILEMALTQFYDAMDSLEGQGPPPAVTDSGNVEQASTPMDLSGGTPQSPEQNQRSDSPIDVQTVELALPEYEEIGDVPISSQPPLRNPEGEEASGTSRGTVFRNNASAGGNEISDVADTEMPSSNHDGGRSSSTTGAQQTPALQGRDSPPATSNSPFRRKSSDSSLDFLAQAPLRNLFPVPTELLWGSTLVRAGQFARFKGRWLLVNIQGMDDFKSMALNRDIWNHDAVKEIIRKNFVFMQVIYQSNEWLTLSNQWRRVQPREALTSDVPTISILHPRTFEKVLDLTGTSATPTEVEDFLPRLLDFLSTNALPASEWGSANDAGEEGLDEVVDLTGGSQNESNPEGAESSRMESATDSSLVVERRSRRAIESYLEQVNGGESNLDSSRELSRLLSETNPELLVHRIERERQDREYQQSLLQDQEREREARLYEEGRRQVEEEKARVAQATEERKAEKTRLLPAEPAAGTPNSTALVLRMPDGTRLSRRFKETDKLQSIFDFVEGQTGLNMEGYELMSQFPRIVFKDGNQDLKSAGLSPHASLIVHQP